MTPKELAQIVELTEKRKRLEENIKSLTESAAQASGEDYQHQVRYLKAKAEELKALKEQEKLAESIRDNKEEVIKMGEKDKALAYDVADANEKIEKRLAAAKNLIKNKSKFSTAEYKTLTKINATELATLKVNRDMANESQHRLMIQDKLLGTLGLSVGAMKDMKEQAILFGRAVMTNPYLLLLAGVAATAMALKKAVTFGLELQDSIGTSASQTIKLTKSFADPAALGQLRLLGVEVSSTTKAFADAFGDVSLATSENLIALGQQKRLLGISVEDSIKLSKEFMSLTGSSYDASLNFQTMAAELAEANDLRPGDVVKELADNTEVFADFAKDGGRNLAEAAVQARKLGLNLSTTAKIANSLLDFESSIEKEMEASMMIGKQLNFNKARQLALEGDIAGAAKDVVSQIGGAAELNKMNVLQRRALAESIGVSTDELSRLATGKLDIKSDTKSVEEQNLAAMNTLQTGQEILTSATKALTYATIALTGVMGAKALMDLGKTLKNSSIGNKLKNTKRTTSGRLNRTSGLGKTLKGTRTGGVVDKLIGAPKSTIGKAAFGQAGKGVAKRIPGVSAVLGGADIVSGVKSGDKGDIGSGAGMIIGGALGSFLGPMGTVVGSMAGQYIGEKVGDYFENSETIEQKKAEEAKVLGNIEEERKDLTAEQDAELQAALSGNANQMQAFIDKYDSMNPFSDTNEVAELLKTLVAKQDGIIQATENLTKD